LTSIFQLFQCKNQKNSLAMHLLSHT